MSMKTADIYIRVSTDEQADKGYSLRYQEEVLRRYCEMNGITVRKVIKEDYSAKSFKRPEWAKMLIDWRKYRGQVDLILFTKWDRFSRNAGDAYQMINILRTLGVEPQAVEQPLDLSIPENKMMLAIYLAAPEVENDRRALNVFYGMRRAKKEGRFMGIAPVGFGNFITEDGKKKYIAPKEPDAGIMRWVFKELSERQFNAEQILKMAREKGLKCSKNNFWVAIRNPVYCGKIFIPKYKDEPAYFVKGQHEPLISEGLFNEVQDVLDGGKKKQRAKLVVDDNFPLRGFLICPKCGRLLTGSSSKGKYQYYSYYHCNSACGWRHSAESTNRLFITDLKKYVPRAGAAIYKRAIRDVYKVQAKDQMDEYKAMLSQLEELTKELTNARRLMLKNDLEPSEYRELKAEYQPKIDNLEHRLANYSVKSNSIDELLDRAINKVTQLDKIYKDGTTPEKRQIVSSIYPQKLQFDGFAFRTPRLNEVIRIICSMDAGFDEMKNGTSSDFTSMSHEVIPLGLEPRTHTLKVYCSTN